MNVAAEVKEIQINQKLQNSSNYSILLEVFYEKLMQFLCPYLLQNAQYIQVGCYLLLLGTVVLQSHRISDKY